MLRIENLYLELYMGIIEIFEYYWKFATKCFSYFYY